MIATALALAAATFVSEDLACVAAGLLVAAGRLETEAALAGCGLGIWLGDCGLWLVGRAGRLAALRSRWIGRRASSMHVRRAAEWLDRNAAAAIVASRFVPGMRLPGYVAAGAAGISLGRFALWSGVATMVWTPILVLGSARLGALGDAWLSPVTRWGAPAGAAAVLALLALTRFGLEPGRQRRLAARIARWRRWEFWPMWLFYAPVVPWVGWLAARSGGLATATAANPGIPDGGTIGESKSAILAALPAAWTIPHVLVPPGRLEDRAAMALAAADAAGWGFPIVMKPDVGQRGVGVKLIADPDGVRGYLSRSPAPVVMQPYHPGPFEAGVFYYRFPDWPAGRILSITDKQFPSVTGDGRSTLADLIWSHPRVRLQAAVFLARHRGRLREIVPAGQVVRLAVAGNHCQGTLFRDGSHLVTPALAARIDAIAQSVPGFFVGRFDIRYRDVEAFKAGRDLAIVELNGATAESTNIYDPAASLLNAYRTLFRQWRIVFAIGAANRARGAAATPLPRLARLAAAHLTTAPAFDVAD